jgi:hypothetical protein
MTRDEFVKYANEFLCEDNFYGYCESVAEFNSEVAMFGDAGPGAALPLFAFQRQVASVERQLARLENREPRSFRLPAPRAPR